VFAVSKERFKIKWVESIARIVLLEHMRLVKEQRYVLIVIQDIITLSKDKFRVNGVKPGDISLKSDKWIVLIVRMGPRPLA
jgi:hypothetical protein